VGLSVGLEEGKSLDEFVNIGVGIGLGGDVSSLANGGDDALGLFIRSVLGKVPLNPSRAAGFEA
jgi:hypothetical protein